MNAEYMAGYRGLGKRRRRHERLRRIAGAIGVALLLLGMWAVFAVAIIGWADPPHERPAVETEEEF